MPCPHQGVLPLVFESSFSIQAGALSRKRQGPCFFGVCNRALRESARFAILRSGVRSPLGPPKKKAAERLSFSLAELRRGENPRFEHKDFFCACKSAAQRRDGTAGQIRSVTERSGVSPLGPPKQNPNHIFSIGDGFGFCFICFFVLPACFFLQNDKQSR